MSMKTVLASGETTLSAHYALCVHMYASVKIIIDNVQVNQDLKAEKEKNQIQYPIFFPPSFNKQTFSNRLHDLYIRVISVQIQH